MTTLRKDLLLLFIIALLTYVVIEIGLNPFLVTLQPWLYQYPQVVQGLYILGTLISSLALAYTSAFVFYFLTIHVKRQRDYEILKEKIGHHVFNIISSSRLFFLTPYRQLSDKQRHFEDLKDSTTFDSFIDSLASLNEYESGRSWYMAVKDLQSTVMDSIRSLTPLYVHLEPNLIRSLDRIERSVFFTQAYSVLAGIENTEITVSQSFSLQMKLYFNLVEDLSEYAEKEFAEYKWNSSESLGFDHETLKLIRGEDG